MSPSFTHKRAPPTLSAFRIATFVFVETPCSRTREAVTSFVKDAIGHTRFSCLIVRSSPVARSITTYAFAPILDSISLRSILFGVTDVFAKTVVGKTTATNIYAVIASEAKQSLRTHRLLRRSLCSLLAMTVFINSIVLSNLYLDRNILKSLSNFFRLLQPYRAPLSRSFQLHDPKAFFLFEDRMVLELI